MNLKTKILKIIVTGVIYGVAYGLSKKVWTL